MSIIGNAGAIGLAGPKSFLLDALRFFPPWLLAINRLLRLSILLGTLGLSLSGLPTLRLAIAVAFILRIIGGFRLSPL